MKNLRNYSYKNYIYLALFAILLLLIFFAQISSAIVSDGVLSYDDAKRNIQHLEGGIVENILVKNGDDSLAILLRPIWLFRFHQH